MRKARAQGEFGMDGWGTCTMGVEDIASDSHRTAQALCTNMTCAMDTHLESTQRLPSPTKIAKVTAILNQVHSNVCGLFSSPSLMGYRYYGIFIDNHSRKTWIFFMKKKEEVFSKFIDIKAPIENQSSRKIRALRSDNGKEYISNSFKELYAKEGIRIELKAPHNPQ